MKKGNLLKNIRAILFDMDGTLVDSMHFHRDSWKELLSHYEIAVSDQFIFEHEGAMAAEVLQGLFERQGRVLDPLEITEIYSRQNQKFLKDFLPLVELFPETLPLLTELRKKGIVLGLVTGSRRNLIDRIWSPRDLALFSVIISADDTRKFKPFPDPYLQALEVINQPVTSCLVVENAPAGIQAALSAGLLCFAVASTLPADKLSQAHQTFSDLGALSNYFLTQIINY